MPYTAFCVIGSIGQRVKGKKRVKAILVDVATIASVLRLVASVVVASVVVALVVSLYVIKSIRLYNIS